MQCLYCETELKPLRGLFDEDFCCKEHREKYLSSFRKGIHLLPVLDLPPLEEKIPNAVTEESAEQPEPVVTLVIDAEPELEPAAEISEPVRELAARSEKPVEVAAVAAHVEATQEEDVAGPAEVTPGYAGFQQLHVSPSGHADCYFMVDENSFAACDGPAIPDVEVFCDAAFDLEEGLAHLMAPVEMAAAGGASGRAGSPQPHPVAPLAPAFRGWNYTAPAVALLEPAELIEDVEMFVPGAISRGMARSNGIHPVAWARAAMAVPGIEISFAEIAEPAVAEQAELEITCPDIEAGPLMFSDFAPVMEMHRPAFQVSAVAMEMEEELKRAIEPPKTEAVRLAEPEIARPAAMSAAPASHTVSATFQPAMPVAARPEAPLNVPAMSSKTEAEPGIASEAVPDPPRGAAAEQPAAHSSEPVQPEIQSSVRIKNWRLKITFAKPA